MNVVQKVVIKAIIAERIRQDIKWGANRVHLDEDWKLILGEESGELSKAIFENKFDCLGSDPYDIERELIDVAAVALAWLEDIFTRKKEKAYDGEEPSLEDKVQG